MVDYIPTVYVILTGAAFLATSVARYLSLRRVITRLKQINMPQWLDMGSPEPTFFSKFSDYSTWRPTSSVVPATQYTELSMWLNQRDYERLNDVEITVNADRYRLLSNVQLVICILAVCTFIYFRFVAHRVAP
jgi:hypothetical protein